MEDKGLLTGLETLIVYPIQLVISVLVALIQYPIQVLSALFSATP